MDNTSHISVTTDGASTKITGAGPLDLYCCEEFDSALRHAASTVGDVVVDLRGATYIDTSIIASLGVAGKRMRDRAKRLRILLSDGTHPLRVLETTGFSVLADLIVESAEG